MKKIAVISLLSLALLGFSEKKITEDMLVGEWDCRTTEQNAKWKNGLFQDYAPPVDRDAYIVKYIKEDGHIFTKLPDSDRKIQENFERMNESFVEYLGDIEINGVNKLEYISDNEYNSISEFTIMQDKSEDNVKTKVLTHCTRIK